MNAKHQTFLLPILLMGSAVCAWSGTPQATSPAAEKPIKQESPASSSSPTAKVKKTEKDSSHKIHLRLGAITVGAGYSHLSGEPYGYPFGRYPNGYGYSPFFWEPFWGPYSASYFPGYFTGFQGADGRGKVQLTASPREAEVFLDGGYAGTAQDLKNIWLDPGAYELSVVAENRAPFHERIYVLSGKTLKVTATLAPPTEVKP